MIGFAGLGKYLNERGLILLKGRRKKEPSAHPADHRFDGSNTTDYTELLSWQNKKRHARPIARIGLLLFRLVFLFGIILMIILLVSRIA